MLNPMHYDHLAYIVASYALFVGTTLYFTVDARRRLARVKRRLQAADPRAAGRGEGG